MSRSMFPILALVVTGHCLLASDTVAFGGQKEILNLMFKIIAEGIDGFRILENLSRLCQQNNVM